jgi:hypothetical protein
MIYDKYAYKIVVAISSYTDEFFIWQIYLALYLSFNGGNNFNPMDFSEKLILSKCNCTIFLRILQCYTLPTCTLCSITEDLNLINTTAEPHISSTVERKKLKASAFFLSLPASL